MGKRRAYVKREAQGVVAVQLDLVTQGFTYEKWGGTQTCKPGQACIEYYGIAGPKGPKFSSCEVKCGKDGSCPKPTTCVTIADGPGRVCR